MADLVRHAARLGPEALAGEPLADDMLKVVCAEIAARSHYRRRAGEVYANAIASARARSEPGGKVRALRRAG